MHERAIWSLILLGLACSEPPTQGLGGSPADGLCEQGLTACGADCVDLGSDASNCGSCGETCEGNEVCRLRRCEAEGCGPGLTACGASCRDTATDPLNCGDCGIACTEEQRCREGRCELFCPSGFAECGGACRDLTRDPSHCGNCDRACAPGEACLDGGCSLVCPAGQSACDQQCFDLERDFNHCGDCNNECARGARCENGSCECPGTLGIDCAGECVDAAVDRANCGRCGAVCDVYCIDADCVIPEELDSDGNGMLARMSDGSIRAWGQNFNGQLGTGSTSNTFLPTLTSNATGLGDVVDVTSGGAHSCAVDGSGEVWCWGSNSVGQLGQPAFPGQENEPVNSGIDDVVVVDAGGAHNCALRTDATVWCWGFGSTGALGAGPQPQSQPNPVRARGIGDVAALGVGNVHSCAVTRAGEVYCWGQNSSRQVGGQSDFIVSVPTQVQGLDPNDTVISVDGGGSHTCALYRSGKVQCWGGGFRGQLGNGTRPTFSDVPVDVSNFSDFVQLDVGFQHSCGVRRNGRVACWGDNGSGQLGDGSSVSVDQPVVVSGLSRSLVQVEAAFATSCARTASGVTSCWGQGVFGQLGNGSNSSSNLPVTVMW